MADSKKRVQVDLGIDTDKVTKAANAWAYAAREINNATKNITNSVPKDHGTKMNTSQLDAMISRSQDSVTNMYASIDKLFDKLDSGLKAQASHAYAIGSPQYRENANSTDLASSLINKLGNNMNVKTADISRESLKSAVKSGAAEALTQVMGSGGVKFNATARNGATSYQRAEASYTRRDINRTASRYGTEYTQIKNRIDNNHKEIGNAANDGYVTFRKNQKINNNYRNASNDINDYRTRLNTELTTQRAVLGSNMSTIASNNAKIADPNNRENETELKNQNAYLGAENEQRQKAIISLDKLSKTVDNLTEKNEANAKDFRDNKRDTTTAVGVDPDSIRGRFMARSFSIIGAASSNVSNTVKDYASKGDNLRSSQYDMYGSNVLASGNSVNAYAGQLKRASGSRYGNLNGEEFNTLATAYTGATGQTGSRDVMGAERIGGNLARSAGFGVQNTAQLMQNSGNLGVRSNRDFQDLGNTLVGAIKDSGMSGKTTQQIQGFNQILGSLQGQNVNARQQEGIANTYMGLGAQNKAWQGQAGATAMQQMTSGISQGFNDPIMRMAFTGGSNKYQGMQGMAKAYGDMQNPLAHPNQTQGMLRNLVNLSGGNKDVAAMKFSQNTGMTMTQAETAVSAAQKGDFAKWAKDTKARENGKKQLSKDESAYNKSGVSTIKAQTATIEANSVDLSSKTDWLRNLKNQTTNQSPIASSLLSGIGQGITQVGLDSMGRRVMNSKLGNRISSRGAALTGGLKDMVTDTAIGRGVGSLRDRAAAKVGGAMDKAGAKIASTKFGAKLTDKMNSRLAKQASEKALEKGANETIAKTGEKTAVKGGEKVLAKGGELGLKAGGKALGAVPFLGTALNAGFAIDDLKNKNYVGAAGDALGMIPGLGLAGDAISIGSQFLPSKFGGGAGGKSGSRRSRLASDVEKGISDSDGKKSGYQTKSEKWISENKKLIDGYNKMLEKMMKTASLMKSALNGNSGSGSGDSGDSDVDVSGTSGKGEAAIKSIAKKLGKKLGIDPSLLYGQMMFESSNGTSPEAKNDLNFGGLKYSASLAKGIKGVSVGGQAGYGEGDNYAKFDSTDAYAKYYAKVLGNPVGGVSYKGSNSVNDFVNRLLKNNYMPASSASNYINNLNSYQKQYSGHATGGIFSHAHTARISEGNMPESVIPMGVGEQSQGRSLVRQTANILGMDLGRESNGNGSSSRRTQSGTTNVSPTFNINISGNNTDENISKIRTEIQNAGEKVTELMRRKVDYYSNDVVL